MNLWQKWMAKLVGNAQKRAEAEQFDTPAERRIAEEGIVGIAEDERVQERLGGTDPNRLIDDEFKP
ncbi:MAG TPA: hypothetical protein VGH52_09825 [Gaiellaceae bacterium]|jgi:hypothetical protein